MNKMLLGALGALAALAAAATIVLYAGAIDVAADVPHHPAVLRLIEFARERAIARAARDLAPPSDLAGIERIRRGAGNYDAMCAGCHLAPGADNSEIRRGLYPTPPDFTRASSAAEPGRAAARQFWIIKHGIKATGMAAWAQGGMDDEAIWDLVALLQKLPGLSAEEYRQFVETSPGHSHAGMEPGGPAPAGHGHDGKGHTHSHAHGEHKH